MIDLAEHPLPRGEQQDDQEEQPRDGRERILQVVLPGHSDGEITAALPVRAAQPSPAKVIDVHTHMYSHGWKKAVEDAKDPNFRIGPNDALIYRGGSMREVHRIADRFGSEAIHRGAGSASGLPQKVQVTS